MFILKIVNRVGVLYTLVVFLLSFFCQAQPSQISGVVRDGANGVTVQGVMVLNQSTGIQAITNSEGVFSLPVHKNDSLLFKHFSYQTLQQESQDQMLVNLELLPEELEEILVFNKSLYDVFSPGLNQVKKLLKQGDLYQCYVREFNIVNQQNSNVADALVDFYVTKPSKRPLVDLKDHRVLQSSQDLDKDAELDQIIGTMGLDVRDVLPNSLDLGIISDILKKEDHYEFQVSRILQENQQELVLLKFKPKPGLKGWKYYQGHVLFEQNLTRVLEYKYALDSYYKAKEHVINVIIAKVQIHDIGRHAFFTQLTDSTYRLSHATSFIDLTISRKLKGKVHMQIVNDLVVDRIQTDVAIPKQKPIKGSLFDQKSDYQSAFWLNRNSRVLTQKETQVLNKLQEI